MRDANCIFCQIASGEAPAWRVHETPATIAFFDINPVNEYHTLVIPKDHYRSFLEAPPAIISETMLTVKTVTDMYREKLQLEDVQIISSAGRIAQQDVFHFHVHIIPRYAGDNQDITPNFKPELVERFDELMTRLK